MWQRLQVSASIEDKKNTVIKQSKVCLFDCVLIMRINNINITKY